MEKRRAKVTVLPFQKSFNADFGENLYQALSQNGIAMDHSICGGKGKCGKCQVKKVEGRLKGEALAGDTYLACKTEIMDDVVIYVAETKDAAARKSNMNKEVLVAPQAGITKVFIRLPLPSIKDQRPDWERLLACLPKGPGYQPRLEVLTILPDVLREAKFEVTVGIRGSEIVTVEKGDTTRQIYGVAFDLGTTSVAAYLLDLISGRILAIRSLGNPQRTVGADVISRIEYTGNNPGGGKDLQERIVTAMNEMIEELIAATGAAREFIYEVTVVGNTTMHHLLLGINPRNIAKAPYVPAIRASVEIQAGKLGIDLPAGGRIYVLPNIAGFVGSDTVGAILATKIYQEEPNRLVLDIGTNGEVALGSRERLLVCSTAAGPAFEGAQIKWGMRAADGAIEQVILSEAGVGCKVIGDVTSVLGICGSGLIQGIAEMLSWEIVDSTGKMINQEEAQARLSPSLARRVRKIEEQDVFVLVEEDLSRGQKAIYITQKDVRELQLAKGALAAGVRILMKEMNLAAEDIQEVLLAGAFGSYIDKKSAQTIGLVPQVSLDKIKSVGNAAGTGAMLALLSGDLRQDARKIAAKAEFIELAGHPDFQSEFVEAMFF